MYLPCKNIFLNTNNKQNQQKSDEMEKYCVKLVNCYTTFIDLDASLYNDLANVAASCIILIFLHSQNCIYLCETDSVQIISQITPVGICLYCGLRA